MQILPIDIENKIKLLYSDSKDRESATKLLRSLWHTSLNVGEEQLARSILTIAGSDIHVIKKIFDSNFFGDPRDVIMEAEKKTGNPGHYFIKPFET